MKGSLKSDAETARLLLVEDSAADTDLVRLAAGQTQTSIDITALTDGADALEYLKNLALEASAVRPHLILLDLRLPTLDGLDTLRAIRADPVLGLLPVVVFSSSDDPGDIDSAYEVGANAFLPKPVDPVTFIDRLERTFQFWFEAAAMPQGSMTL